jgi:pimeloyl-ACP methyl ester carboxylesterase
MNPLTGTVLRYSDTGSGIPVVLLHAYPTNRHLFDGLAGAIPGRLITPDLPGFGETPLPEPAPEVLAVADLVDLVGSWLDERALGPAILGGNAIGGYVMIELVARRPELARAMILLGCKPAPDAATMRPAREAAAAYALEHGSVAVADQLVSPPLAPGASEQVLAAHRAMIEAADPRGIAGLVRGLAQRPDPTPSLRTLRLPVLALCGAFDPFTKPELARELAEMLPNGRYVEIEGAGHLPTLEQPEATARAIKAFVAELEGRGEQPRDH